MNRIGGLRGVLPGNCGREDARILPGSGDMDARGTPKRAARRGEPAAAWFSSNSRSSRSGCVRAAPSGLMSGTGNSLVMRSDVTAVGAGPPGAGGPGRRGRWAAPRSGAARKWDGCTAHLPTGAAQLPSDGPPAGIPAASATGGGGAGARPSRRTRAGHGTARARKRKAPGPLSRPIRAHGRRRSGRRRTGVPVDRGSGARSAEVKSEARTNSATPHHRPCERSLINAKAARRPRTPTRAGPCLGVQRHSASSRMPNRIPLTRQ